MRKAYVYKFYDKNDLLLYVGCSLDLLTRIAGHQSSSKWFKKVKTIRIETFSDKKTARKKERNLIESLQPKHNKLHNGKAIISTRVCRSKLDHIVTGRRPSKTKYHDPQQCY